MEFHKPDSQHDEATPSSLYLLIPRQFPLSLPARGEEGGRSEHALYVGERLAATVAAGGRRSGVTGSWRGARVRWSDGADVEVRMEPVTVLG